MIEQEDEYGVQANVGALDELEAIRRNKRIPQGVLIYLSSSAIGH